MLKMNAVRLSDAIGMAHEADEQFSRLNFNATCWCRWCSTQHRMNVVQGITLSTCVKGNVGSFHFRVGFVILRLSAILTILSQCEFSGVSQWIHPQRRDTFYWQAVQQLVDQRIRLWNLPGRRFNVTTTAPMPSTRTTATTPSTRTTAPTPSTRTTAPTPSTRTAAPTPSTSLQPQRPKPSRSATRIVNRGSRGVKRERAPSVEIVGEIRRRPRRSPSVEIIGEYRRPRSPSVEIVGEYRRARSPSVELLN
jgi:hypothetical protein